MPISEETYRRVALEACDQNFELRCGRLVAKPPMTWEHADGMNLLVWLLQTQLGLDEYRVHTDHSRARVSATHYNIPDVAVIPLAMARRLFTEPGMLEAYREPLPLIVEIWSPSTREYDVETKLPEYEQRGDAEIWFLHPYEHTLRARRRQLNGSYVETLHTGGIIRPHSLPNVAVDLDWLFARMRP